MFLEMFIFATDTMNVYCNKYINLMNESKFVTGLRVVHSYTCACVNNARQINMTFILYSCLAHPYQIALTHMENKTNYNQN